MQAFAVPGSVMLSVLGGALFGLWVGIVVVLLAASIGSTFCYLISYYLGHPIVEKYLTERIAKLKKKVEEPNNHGSVYWSKGSLSIKRSNHIIQSLNRLTARETSSSSTLLSCASPPSSPVRRLSFDESDELGPNEYGTNKICLLLF